jgi:pimeloyl-ACP methyl ester carboxylesterase
MAELAFTRAGSGPPLVLLHGIGLSRRSWDPVVPALAEHFDVLAIDLPGFGESEPMPPQVEPTPAALAASVADLLDNLGIGTPHLVGNSLGGWVALELAHIRPTASLTLLCPAGLWRGETPLYCRASLRATRWLAQHASGLLCWLVKRKLGRILVLGQTHGQPSKMSADQARAAVYALGTCPGFYTTLAATARRHYRAGPPIDAPVTVAFGSRDLLLLPWQSRHLDELPAGTHLRTLPGCGHIPMGDNPAAVIALIIAATVRGLAASALGAGERR